MTWGMAEAGNRASKTGHYLQWLDTEAESDSRSPEYRFYADENAVAVQWRQYDG